jgi:polyvinyl alcohol dehydrogenase (cytochrome)
MRVFRSLDGSVAWEYDTNREFTTVNGVKARGGSLNGGGATVVDGRVYFTSGYGLFGMPGNVLLAFGPRTATDKPKSD